MQTFRATVEGNTYETQFYADGTSAQFRVLKSGEVKSFFGNSSPARRAAEICRAQYLAAKA